MGKTWDVAAEKCRPLDPARIAVVGEELGTQFAKPLSRIARLEAENAQLRAELIQLRADFTEHRRRGAQTPVVASVPQPPLTKPTIPARALTFHHQVVGLLTGKPGDAR